MVCKILILDLKYALTKQNGFFYFAHKKNVPLPFSNSQWTKSREKPLAYSQNVFISQDNWCVPFPIVWPLTGHCIVHIIPRGQKSQCHSIRLLKESFVENGSRFFPFVMHFPSMTNSNWTLSSVFLTIESSSLLFFFDQHILVLSIFYNFENLINHYKKNLACMIWYFKDLL